FLYNGTDFISPRCHYFFSSSFCYGTRLLLPSLCGKNLPHTYGMVSKYLLYYEGRYAGGLVSDPFLYLRFASGRALRSPPFASSGRAASMLALATLLNKCWRNAFRR